MLASYEDVAPGTPLILERKNKLWKTITQFEVTARRSAFKVLFSNEFMKFTRFQTDLTVISLFLCFLFFAKRIYRIRLARIAHSICYSINRNE